MVHVADWYVGGCGWLCAQHLIAFYCLNLKFVFLYYPYFKQLMVSCSTSGVAALYVWQFISHLTPSSPNYCCPPVENCMWIGRVMLVCHCIAVRENRMPGSKPRFKKLRLSTSDEAMDVETVTVETPEKDGDELMLCQLLDARPDIMPLRQGKCSH